MIKKFILFILLSIMVMPLLTFATSDKHTVIEPKITPKIFDAAKANTNWKLAFVTGKHGQVVFMNISPLTNPSNEIGMETHLFDQIILIVDGNGNAVLNGKTSIVRTGDMIFVPQGTAHNVINASKEKPLKILSIYSNTDIPANSVYQKKSEEPKIGTVAND